MIPPGVTRPDSRVCRRRYKLVRLESVKDEIPGSFTFWDFYQVNFENLLYFGTRMTGLLLSPAFRDGLYESFSQGQSLTVTGDTRIQKN